MVDFSLVGLTLKQHDQKGDGDYEGERQPKETKVSIEEDQPSCEEVSLQERGDFPPEAASEEREHDEWGFELVLVKSFVHRQLLPNPHKDNNNDKTQEKSESGRNSKS